MSERPLRLLIPDNALGQRVLELMRQANLEVPPLASGGSERVCCVRTRETLGAALEVILLHPRDVATYVWYGVADLGVPSSTALVESRAQVYRPYTFAFGGYPLVLAASHRHELSSLVRLQQLRVATTLRSFAQEHFAARGWPIDLIGLHGSPARAVSLGLAEVALMTLTQPEILGLHGLAVIEEVGRSELKLVANRAASRLRRAMIERLVETLASADRPTG